MGAAVAERARRLQRRREPGAAETKGEAAAARRPRRCLGGAKGEEGLELPWEIVEPATPAPLPRVTLRAHRGETRRQRPRPPASARGKEFPRWRTAKRSGGGQGVGRGGAGRGVGGGRQRGHLQGPGQAR